MPDEAEAIVDSVGRQRLAFERRTDEDGTAVADVHCWVDPTGGVPPHIHPHQTEHFRVLEGEMTFTAGRAKKRVPAGEDILVPPGTRHAYENRGDEPAYMVCTATPAADLVEFLTETAELGREGHIRRIGPLRGPAGPRSLPVIGAFLKRHRENTVILMPPPLVQRLVLDRLARFADR
jgi:quercetin dioxygenase-like cupin family protein